MPFHLFQNGWIDRPQRDIIWLKTQRTVKLGKVMRADAQLQSCAFYRDHIGIITVFLSQMHKRTALINCDLPMIIDNKHSARSIA